jgi:hypothetical protein
MLRTLTTISTRGAALALGCFFLLPAALHGQEPAPSAVTPAEASRTAPAEAAAQRPEEAVRPRARRDRSRITEEEIRETSHANALAVVQALRPTWLRYRGTASINRVEVIRVYVDGVPAGGVRALQGIAAYRVVSMQHLGGPAATARFGTEHTAGAILVETR